MPPVKLDGLDPAKNYMMKEINLADGKSSWLSVNGKVITGEILIKEGIALPLNNEYDSIVVELTEQ